MDYLPTKRFIIPALTVAVALTGAFFYFKTDEPEGLSYDNQAAALVEAAPDPKTTLEQNYLGVEEDATKDQLAVSNDNDTAALKKYGVELAVIMGEFTAATRESEPELMFKALEKGEKQKALTEIAKLKNLAEIYHRTSLHLAELEIPSELADGHLIIVNSVARLETHVRNMGAILDDPMKAITSADEYVKESRNLYTVLTAMNDFFAAKNISFSEEERAEVTLYEVQ